MSQRCCNSTTHFAIPPEQKIKIEQSLYTFTGIDRPKPHSAFVDYYLAVPVYCTQSVAFRYYPWFGAEHPLPDPSDDPIWRHNAHGHCLAAGHRSDLSV
jgi:hypothetical protein